MFFFKACAVCKQTILRRVAPSWRPALLFLGLHALCDASRLLPHLPGRD